MGKQTPQEPDGDPDVGDGIKRITESPRPRSRREPNGDPDVSDGLTYLTHSDDER